MTTDPTLTPEARRAERSTIIRDLYPVGRTCEFTFRPVPYSSRETTVYATVVSYAGAGPGASIVIGSHPDLLTIPFWKLVLPERGIQ